MKKVCVVGHFGFGENMLNGQTIKTKTVTTELEKQLGADQVMKIDTHGGAKGLPKIIVQLISAFKNCKNIIILPAHNGVKVFVPLCNILNRLFHKKLHYVVIGGWLNSLLDNVGWLEKYLKKFNGIYVETNTMKAALNSKGFTNIFILPNFKDVEILKKEEFVYQITEPFKLCTFSRVMKEKGIEEAVNAVVKINKTAQRVIYTLDIYGQIDSEQTEWFNELSQTFPEYINYRGMVDFDKSVSVLKNYYALLFPTLFFTEGIPGTIIDAYAAAIPVICSKWESFSDIVEDGTTGFGYEFNSNDDFIRLLEEFSDGSLNQLKDQTILKAEEYMPSYAIQTLLKNMR